ncbi:MAG: GreA/GreB family elongation factor, partial [Bdellovibrionota bacterium]
DRLDAAEVVDPKTMSGDKVRFGAKVTVTSEDGETHVYQIVGADELDLPQGKISWKSPMAKALLGKNVGDEAIVQKPNGSETYSIEEVSYS